MNTMQTVLAVMLASGAAVANDRTQADSLRYEVRANPAISERGVLPGLTELTTATEASGFFGSGNPPGSLFYNWRFEYTNTQTVALIENFDAVAGPTRSAADFGLGDPTSLDPLFAAYFAQFPEVEWAVAWTTGGQGDVFLSQSVIADRITLGPAGRCSTAPALTVTQSVSGSPNLSDGIAGVDLIGVVSQNELCYYADNTGATGHAFVSLRPTIGPPSFHGFYPGNSWPISDAGRFNNDGGRNWTHRACYLLTQSQYAAAAGSVRSSQQNGLEYDLFDGSLGGEENCTSWAASILDGIGLTVPGSTTFGLYDPGALDSSLAGAVSGGSLFGGCGLAEASESESERMGGFPINYSPVELVTQGLLQPMQIAGTIDLPLVEMTEAPVQIAIGAVVTVEIAGDGDADFGGVLWPDGQTELLFNGLSTSRVLGQSGDLLVVAFEDGSLQHFTVPVEVTPGGLVTADIVLVAEDFAEVTSENGPFTEPEDPATLDVGSCATDCNSNSIPDCEEGVPSLDCNGNGVLDACDIATGASADQDQDGLPDECQSCSLADLAAPFGLLDLADTLVFVNAFTINDPIVDFDDSGLLDLADIVAFVEAFLTGCD